MKKPETGGRFERDKKTKRLKRVQDPTKRPDDEVTAETNTAKQADTQTTEGN